MSIRSLDPARTATRARGTDVEFDVGALGRVLGIWAHPDDETYLSGGVMAAAATNGQPAACITATAGEHGTTDPLRWPPARLARERRRELRRALRVLGVRRHEILGYRDGGLTDVDDVRAVHRIRSRIDRMRPDTIITFGPDGFTGHTDHQVISRWVTHAVAARPHITVLHTAKTHGWIERFSGLHDRFPIFYPGHPNGVDTAELALDLWLDDDALDHKTEALLAHRTQTEAITEVLGCSEWQEWIRRESFVLHRPGTRPEAAGYHASMRGGL